MSEPRRHHYVAQHYLRRWSPDGKQVAVLNLPLDRGIFVASTKSLSVEKDLYTIETPGGRNQVIERELAGAIDSAFATAIELLLRGERASHLDLATAIGFQLMRGPEVKAQLSHIKTEIVRAQEKFSRLFAGEDVDEAALESIVENAEQNEWVAALVSSILDVAEVFTRMRWHLIYFREPLLVTSDSPISFWRREELNTELVGIGLESVDEVRLPLAPTLALVMTWDEGAPRRLRGDIAMARELNIGTVEFAQQQRVFVVPDPPPPFRNEDDQLPERRPVVADLSVLPPLQAHRREMGASLIEELTSIPGLEDIAAQLSQATELEPEAGE